MDGAMIKDLAMSISGLLYLYGEAIKFFIEKYFITMLSLFDKF